MKTQKWIYSFIVCCLRTCLLWQHVQFVKPIKLSVLNRNSINQSCRIGDYPPKNKKLCMPLGAQLNYRIQKIHCFAFKVLRIRNNVCMQDTLDQSIFSLCQPKSYINGYKSLLCIEGGHICQHESMFFFCCRIMLFCYPSVEM